MTIDVGDVTSLCMAHEMEKRGEVRLLAVVHGTGYSRGIGAVSSINHFFDADHVMLGAYTGPVGLPANSALPLWTSSGKGVYVDDIVDKFPGPVRDASQVQSALQVYRQTLAAEADGSVTIASIGFLTNLYDLLLSEADDASPLAGPALVAQKVKRLVIMAGRYHMNPGDSVEWNLGGCGGTGGGSGGNERGCGGYDLLGPMSNKTFSLWPQSVPMRILPFEAGLDVHTGRVLSVEAPDSPCGLAYKLFCDRMDGWCESNGRSSWDPMTVLLAVRGPQSPLFPLETGRMKVNHIGKNTWTPTPAGHYTGQQIVTLAGSSPVMEQYLDRLYLGT